MLRIGTANFTSRRAAESYYGAYCSNVKATVARKLAEGEIKIGKPELRPGEKLELCDNGARYVIVCQ